MILGIGTDLIELVRMERACSRDAFLVRTFTQEECRQAQGRIPVLVGILLSRRGGKA